MRLGVVLVFALAAASSWAGAVQPDDVGGGDAAVPYTMEVTNTLGHKVTLDVRTVVEDASSDRTPLEEVRVILPARGSVRLIEEVPKGGTLHLIIIPDASGGTRAATLSTAFHGCDEPRVGFQVIERESATAAVHSASFCGHRLMPGPYP